MAVTQLTQLNATRTEIYVETRFAQQSLHHSNSEKVYGKTRQPKNSNNKLHNEQNQQATSKNKYKKSKNKEQD